MQKNWLKNENFPFQKLNMKQDQNFEAKNLSSTTSLSTDLDYILYIYILSHSSIQQRFHNPSPALWGTKSIPMLQQRISVNLSTGLEFCTFWRRAPSRKLVANGLSIHANFTPTCMQRRFKTCDRWFQLPIYRLCNASTAPSALRFQKSHIASAFKGSCQHPAASAGKYCTWP